ncbi:MAG: beta strand repeat-containing protein, partial [Candidatus Kapaibacterium sp.]
MHYQLFTTKRIRRVPVVLGLFFLFVSVPLLSQNRDFSAERLILDDNANDGTRNTMTLRVPPTGLSANRTLTFPDADGTVLTVTAPLNPNEILFGSPTGQAAQNANLLWDDGAGIFNIGAGNFTVDAATGDVQTAGNIQADGTIQSGASIIIDGTTPGSHNITATGGENLTITPTGGTLFVDAIVLNHSSGLFTVNPGTLQYGLGLFTVDPGTLQYGSGLFTVDPGTLQYGLGLFTVDPGTLTYNGAVVNVPGTLVVDPATFSFSGGVLTGNPGTLNYNSGLFTVDPGTLQYGSGLFTVDPGTLQYGSGLFSVDPGTLTYNGAVVNVPGTLVVDPGTFSFSGGVLTGDPGTLNYNSGLFTVDPGPSLNLAGGFFTVNPGGISYNGGVFAVSPIGAVISTGAGSTFGDGTDAAQVTIAGTVGVGAYELQVNGDAQVTGALDVGTLTLNGDLNMSDNDIFNIDELRGNSGTGDLNVNTTNTGDVNIGNGSGDVNVDADVIPTTDNTYSLGTDALRWSGVFVNGGSVHIGDANGVGTDEVVIGYNGTTTGTIGVNGTTAINVTTTGVNVTGNLDVDTDLNVDGNTTHVGTLDQQGAVSNSTGDVVINDDANVTGSLDVDTDLNVDGNTTHVGTLDQQGAVSNSTGDVVINDDANVTGSLDVDTDLNVDGNTTHVGTTDLQGFVGNTAGDLNLFDNVNVTGDLDIGAGNFTVEAATGNTDVGGTLNAEGATTLNGAVTLGDAAADAITFTGQVASDIVPNADATYDLGSNTNRFDELFVSGPTIHIGSSADEAQISFNGGTGLELDGNDDGTSDLTIDGATGDVTVAGALSVMGPVSFPASPLTLGDDVTPTPGQLILEDNTAANGFQGTVETAPVLTADRTYTLPDASGVISLVGDIVTDATLSGDGSGGNPLGIDLTNANTWTGTQTLPVTAAQGDALIASTNAGTTTIDAARIGAGLTDAQVNDNLTINGGTVDATPIGATTPSTGAFTTITGTALPAASTSTDLVTSNGGALETRTVASLAGSIAVSTDATLTGDGTTGNPLGIDLTNANTWTATQTLPVTAAQGDALIASTNAGTTTIDAARIG